MTEIRLSLPPDADVTLVFAAPPLSSFTVSSDS
jgi:hypothetical protein